MAKLRISALSRLTLPVSHRAFACHHSGASDPQASRAQRAQVCFAGEPTWLALEWTDGAPAAMYITPHRDALAAALLDAAQVLRTGLCAELPVFLCRHSTRLINYCMVGG